MVLLDAEGDPGDLAGGEVLKKGERELRRSCRGRSGLEAGKMRSRREFCIITFRSG